MLLHDGRLAGGPIAGRAPTHTRARCKPFGDGFALPNEKASGPPGRA